MRFKEVVIKQGNKSGVMELIDRGLFSKSISFPFQSRLIASPSCWLHLF